MISCLLFDHYLTIHDNHLIRGQQEFVSHAQRLLEVSHIQSTIYNKNSKFTTMSQWFSLEASPSSMWVKITQYDRQVDR